MMNLLYKLIKLTAQPMTFIFCLFGAMFLIPNYPYTIVFFYVTLGLFFTYINVREQRDVYYSMLLPVGKKEYVDSCGLFMVMIEVLSFVLGIPFVILSHKINPAGNAVGFDASLALYGAGLIMYGIFNAIYLTSFFKNGYKVGSSFVKALIPMSLVMIILEVLTHFPTLSFLDGWTAVGPQFVFFLIGLVFYVVLTYLSLRKAEKLFEAVDL